MSFEADFGGIMKKADLILLLLFIGVTIGATVLEIQHKFSAEASQAIVYSDGAILQTLAFPLKDQVIPIKTAFGTNTIEVKAGKIYMIDADCRDKLCVHSKAIQYNGEMIVCLPHKLYVEIKSKKEASLDAVSM